MNESEYSDHIVHSNRIEGEPTEWNHLSMQGHLRGMLAAMRAAIAEQILHPRVIHGIMFDGYYDFSGKYRHEHVGIHGRNGWVEFASPDKIEGLMNDWWYRALRWWDHQDPWGFHAEFEAIHPFQDGNGRTGRVVMWNMEILLGQEPTLIKYEDRFEYYDRLEKWRAEHL